MADRVESPKRSRKLVPILDLPPKNVRTSTDNLAAGARLTVVANFRSVGGGDALSTKIHRPMHSRSSAAGHRVAYRTCEAAEILGRSKWTILRRCRAGGFPGAVRDGKDWLIPVEDVELYLQRLRQKRSDDPVKKIVEQALARMA